MISVSDLEITLGARTLMMDVNFRVGPGDKVGLVGRNGAGKTTLSKVLAGEALATAGVVKSSGLVGYLPQDPRIENTAGTARERILEARGLGNLHKRLADAATSISNSSDLNSAMQKYSKTETAFLAAGGYAAEAEASAIAGNLGIQPRVLDQSLSTLSGGQRRRVELARILFSKAESMVLDEPTNHLDADSISWLRAFLKSYPGALIVISHDVELISLTVNRVFYLDATRKAIDVYNMNWKNYQKQREVDEERRKRERTNAEKKAAALSIQAERFGAKASKAAAAHQMQRRADELLKSIEPASRSDRTANIRFPEPSPCGKTPLTASNLSKSYGSLEIFTAIDIAIDKGSKVVIIGLNGAGKTTLLRILAGIDQPDTGLVSPGHGLKIGYYAQEHETLDVNRTVLENVMSASPELTNLDARKLLGSFLFSGDDVEKPAGVLSGGEKTRLALATIVLSKANVLLLDEPTNNLDPSSREQILNALATFQGAIVLVSHDEGAVRALNPERVLVLPDGIEDFWSEDYAELISLS